jgi:transglutaminase-like putative cysteine protease
MIMKHRSTAGHIVKTSIETRLVYEAFGPTHFRMQLAAMRSPRQHVASESLSVTGPDGATLTVREFSDAHGNRMHRFDAPPGVLRLTYKAEVERRPADLDEPMVEYPITELPDELLSCLVPTRYCEVDKLGNFAIANFGNLPPGHERVQGVVDWVRHNIAYRVGSSGAMTTAHDVLEQRAGVCRDFAHLSIALCRALNIPARLVVGYVIFDEPPQDFHAIFEVWLGHWVSFDPTGLAPTDRFVRVGVGSDAKDVAFATMFGPVALRGMEIDLVDEDAATGYRREADNSMHVLPLLPLGSPMELPATAAVTLEATPQL